MIIRIVRMTFQEDMVESFLENFNANKQKIRAFEGCHELQLMKDPDKENILSTYSVWESVDHLNDYRHSDLFKAVWSKTKPLFSNSPVAFSLSPFMKV
ncbi:MAG: antibiotic biosynthesis monooxygenase [Cyclobacteriaceae bacterium]|nr:antibiotic biosynthesis monooxygenase [Cyclobacteriaceae bacterium]MCH8515669.1 antibiotic biosynthesis monooxygenase [Cyclobacteriaceae bacterium]